MARAELDLVIANALQMYEDMKVDRAEMMRILRTQPREAWNDYLREWKENTASVYKGTVGFAIAMDMLNIVSPRFYAHGVDITDAMREALYLNEETEGNDDWKMFLEALDIYEKDCVKAYACAVRGVELEESVQYKNYRHYLDCTKAVNEYFGENVDEDFFEINTKRFRELVNDLMDARKNCVAIINFEPRVIPKEMRGMLKKGLSYEEAQDIVETIRENIGKSTESKRSFGEEDYPIEDVMDSIFDTALPYEKKKKSVKQILEKSFIINYLEACGVDRKSLYKYRKDLKHQPYKKAMFAMGMYSEPYANYDDDDAECESVIKQHMETFMNQNGQSICSQYATISEFDDLMDADIVLHLEDGVPEDAIAYMLKYFGKTKRKVD